MRRGKLAWFLYWKFGSSAGRVHSNELTCRCHHVSTVSTPTSPKPWRYDETSPSPVGIVQPEGEFVEDNRVILHLVGVEMEVTWKRKKEEMDCWHVCEALLQFIWSYLIRVTCGREAICKDDYFDLSIRHAEGKSFNVIYLMLVRLKHAFDIDTVCMLVYLGYYSTTCVGNTILGHRLAHRFVHRIGLVLCIFWYCFTVRVAHATHPARK